MRNSSRRRPTRKRQILIEFGQIGLLLLLIMAGRSSLADHYHVPTGSMQPTLMPGDRVVVDKTAYGLRLPFTKIDIVNTNRPQRGDIAVFDAPDTGVLLIKRIVAVGGDQVDLINGVLWIDGRRLSAAGSPAREFFDDLPVDLDLDDGGGPNIHGLVIPRGQLLALGDHRGNSRDGRYFGLIDERELYGRALAVYFSRRDGFGWNAL